jgi:hypothetical protein
MGYSSSIFILLPSTVSVLSTLLFGVMLWQFQATVTMLLSFHFTVKTSLCTLKDTVPHLSFFSKVVFAKGISGDIFPK